jgi:hypothetical protein
MKKNPKECFCALCRSPRKLRYSRFLSKMNYLQIIFISAATAGILYPLIGFKGIVCLPVIWALFESIHKSLYRKELVCPFCGFDPKWYKKDVKLARQKVEEFLRENPETPILRRVRKEDPTTTQLN